MHLEIPTEKSDHLKSTSQSKLLLRDIYSSQELEGIIERMVRRYADSGNITMNAVRIGMRSSEYLEKILSGNITELADFLETFYTKKACGFFHERIVRIHGELLTQNSCSYKHSYSGCGHPELNGMLIAIAMAEYILDEDIQIGSMQKPSYVTLRRLDASANSEFYQSEQGIGDVKVIHGNLAYQQDLFGSQARELCQTLARNLRSLR